MRRAPCLALARLIAVLALPIAPPALAQNGLCGPHPALAGQLAADYGEQPVAIGLTNDGLLVEIFVADGRRTFTLLLTRPDGLACILLAGQGWQGPVAGEPGEDS